MPVPKKTTLRRNVPKGDGLRRAATKAQMMAADSSASKPYSYPIKPPILAPGVVPAGVSAPVLAMDSTVQDFLNSGFPGGGFPGFPLLAQLATRAEYRAFAAAISTELTREWLEFTSSQDDGADSSDKIKAIEAEFKRLNVRETIQRAAEHDSFFGRGQLFIEIAGADRKTPLILDKRTVKVGSLSRVVAVEAMWTTPVTYNALDPVAPDFYKPSRWFMLGQEVHASRLLTIVTRPLPDMLKPAFNFGGMSMSQLAEPYVENWLRTRQSVADLINNFSITAIATSMDQVLQGDDDGTDLFKRADLFTATRSNKGLMLLDKEREELIQVNTPLSGLHELQAQSQEHMCSVSRTPAIILTGISPSGLNASSDGEIRVFYDWIAAQQEAYWRAPLEIILKVVQLSLFGEIDPDIGLAFIPLYQMTPKEESEIRTADGATDVAYVTAGILDPSEVRDKLAKDPASGYVGLDTSVEIVPPEAASGEIPPDGLGQDADYIAEIKGHDFDELIDDDWEFGSDDPTNYAADGWITVHPNGPDAKGQPAFIGEGGVVEKGMGGKFNGQKITEIHKGFSGPKSPVDKSGETINNSPTETKSEGVKMNQTSTAGEKVEPNLNFGKPPLTEGERNNIARSELLYQKYGSKEQGGRGEFKAAARAGNFDNLHDEHVANEADILAKQNAAKAEKNKAWRDKHLPGLVAQKRSREEAAAAEKRTKVDRAKSYAEAIGSTDKTYLNVPFSMKDHAKANGAFWDADVKKWFVGGDVPESLKSYIAAPAAPAARKYPTRGNVSSDDPSIYGSWLLGYEGEPWSRVLHMAPK